MSMHSSFSNTDSYLTCAVKGMFTLDDGMSLFEKILAASVRVEVRLILIDCTEIQYATVTLDKLLWAYDAQIRMREFQGAYGYNSKIAIFGNEPFITAYKSASDFFTAEKISIQTFSSEQDAREWLGIDL